MYGNEVLDLVLRRILKRGVLLLTYMLSLLKVVQYASNELNNQNQVYFLLQFLSNAKKFTLKGIQVVTELPTQTFQ